MGINVIRTQTSRLIEHLRSAQSVPCIFFSATVTFKTSAPHRHLLAKHSPKVSDANHCFAFVCSLIQCDQKLHELKGMYVSHTTPTVCQVTEVLSFKSI